MKLSKKLDLYLDKLIELKKLYEKEELEEVYRKLHPARKVLVKPIVVPIEKITDELYRNGIPYKYEMPMELEGWKKKVLIYPDFTVLNKRTGKKWIIEHLGMMDKPAYYENAMQKVSTYEKNGILLGDGLIVLHETSGTPLNTVVLKKYIEKYLC